MRLYKRRAWCSASGTCESFLQLLKVSMKSSLRGLCNLHAATSTVSWAVRNGLRNKHLLTNRQSGSQRLSKSDSQRLRTCSYKPVIQRSSGRRAVLSIFHLGVNNVLPYPHTPIKGTGVCRLNCWQRQSGPIEPPGCYRSVVLQHAGRRRRVRLMTSKRSPLSVMQRASGCTLTPHMAERKCYPVWYQHHI